VKNGDQFRATRREEEDCTVVVSGGRAKVYKNGDLLTTKNLNTKSFRFLDQDKYDPLQEALYDWKDSLGE